MIAMLSEWRRSRPATRSKASFAAHALAVLFALGGCDQDPGRGPAPETVTRAAASQACCNLAFVGTRCAPDWDDYDTTDMLPQYVHADRENEVTYFNEQERAAFVVTIKDGKLYDASGKLIDTANIKPPAYSSLFVMAADGTIYLSKQDVASLVQHSSYLAGGPVAGAGTMTVDKGVLKSFSDQSGHYQPKRKFSEQVLLELHFRGVDVSNVDLNWSAQD